MRTRFLLTVAIMLCGLLMAEPLYATDVGHYVPGGFATLIDLPPTKPGWVLNLYRKPLQCWGRLLLTN